MPKCFLPGIIELHCLWVLPGAAPAGVDGSGRLVGERNLPARRNGENVLLSCVTRTTAFLINCAISRREWSHTIRIRTPWGISWRIFFFFLRITQSPVVNKQPRLNTTAGTPVKEMSLSFHLIPLCAVCYITTTQNVFVLNQSSWWFLFWHVYVCSKNKYLVPDHLNQMINKGYFRPFPTNKVPCENV